MPGGAAGLHGVAGESQPVQQLGLLLWAATAAFSFYLSVSTSSAFS